MEKHVDCREPVHLGLRVGRPAQHPASRGATGMPVAALRERSTSRSRFAANGDGKERPFNPKLAEAACEAGKDVGPRSAIQQDDVDQALRDHFVAGARKDGSVAAVIGSSCVPSAKPSVGNGNSDIDEATQNGPHRSVLGLAQRQRPMHRLLESVGRKQCQGVCEVPRGLAPRGRQEVKTAWQHGRQLVAAQVPIAVTAQILAVALEEPDSLVEIRKDVEHRVYWPAGSAESNERHV
mmetsp:Transcript_101335/g.285797  ORF Transcript_101335/g.285797 Transcript_101335/m.285797 type:complete len:237 (-) Transcript_101335:956-1666(-)